MAQKNFEGKMVLSMSYPDLPEEMKAYESMMPQGMTIFIKGEKSRMEQENMMGSTYAVSDFGSKSGFVEMDMGGQKMRLLIDEGTFTDQSNTNTAKDIQYVDETKEIAGYACKKAIVTMSEDMEPFTVYYTEKISTPAQSQFIGLKGFPMEYEVSQSGMHIIVSVTEIQQTSIDNAIFNKKEGYKEVTQEELGQMMMGGGVTEGEGGY